MSKTIEFSFPFLILRLKNGIGLMDKISKFPYVKSSGWAFLYLMPLLAIVAVYVLLFTLSIYITEPIIRDSAREAGPSSLLLIPGINPFLPIFYGWVGIFVGILVHEGAHGVMAKALDVPVKSSGLLLLFVVPIGAFVEVDDENAHYKNKSNLNVSGRIIAAGSGANFLFGLIALLLLASVVGTMQPVSSGVPVGQVFLDYPAHNSGLMPGDYIVMIDDSDIENIDDLGNKLSAYGPDDIVQVDIVRKTGPHSFSITLAEHPDYDDRAFLGVVGLPLDPSVVLNQYQNAFGLSSSMLIYLTFPTGNQILVPYSDFMSLFYTSSIGDVAIPLANAFFWIWFINFNLGIFNSLPIYPLDGGQAFRRFLYRFFGNKLQDNTVIIISRLVTILVVFMLVSIFVFPYLLS